MTHAHVQRIRIETRDGAKRATGVELRSPQTGETMVEARREVILAAGSIGSPQILQLSGCRPGRAAARIAPAGHTRAARRGRELARPSAGSHGVQGEQRADAEPARQQLCPARRRWGWSICCSRPARSPCRPRSSVPSPAAIRRRPRPTSSGTCSRCRWTSSASRCTRSRRSRRRCAICSPPAEVTCASRAPTRTRTRRSSSNYLSDRRGPPGCRGLHALHAPDHGGPGAGQVSSRKR